MKGVKLAASVPRGISAESGRRLFQALVPLASTPLEVGQSPLAFAAP